MTACDRGVTGPGHGLKESLTRENSSSRRGETAVTARTHHMTGNLGSFPLEGGPKTAKEPLYGPLHVGTVHFSGHSGHTPKSPDLGLSEGGVA